MIPERLSNWNLQALEALCASGQNESDRHDFKFGLSDPKSVTKVCCAFANTFGGFLVIGVSERGPGFIVTGIDPDRELYAKLVAKVRADPDISISSPLLVAVPGSNRLVYVFEIPRSPRRPHLPTERDNRIFWKRVGSTCEQMTLEEIRYQMNSYEEKREKISLLVIELSHIVRSMVDQGGLPDGAYNGNIFTFDILDRVVVESYALLKEDPTIFGALDTIKKRLMTLNFEKQKLLSVISQSYNLQYKILHANEYRDHVKSSIPSVVILCEQIERSIKERFSIVNPYKAC